MHLTFWHWDLMLPSTKFTVKNCGSEFKSKTNLCFNLTSGCTDDYPQLNVVRGPPSPPVCRLCCHLVVPARLQLQVPACLNPTLVLPGLCAPSQPSLTPFPGSCLSLGLSSSSATALSTQKPLVPTLHLPTDPPPSSHQLECL